MHVDRGDLSCVRRTYSCSSILVLVLERMVRDSMHGVLSSPIGRNT